MATIKGIVIQYLGSLVQVANPDALTILIDGDGSFGMTNMDLQTVKRWAGSVSNLIASNLEAMASNPIAAMASNLYSILLGFSLIPVL